MTTFSPDPTAIGIRRLSGAAYDNTVRDLIGTTARFAATFPDDEPEPPSTNVPDALTLGPRLRAAYDAAADQLAGEALQAPRVMICDPVQLGTDECATKILARFVTRAWRRPAAAGEVERLVQGVHDAAANGACFTEGLRAALKSTLVSDSFLFRIERDPDPTSNAIHPVSEFELASRLSYFLWSSMPDDALFTYAEAGRLSQPATFDRQVTRMLADPRAAGLAEGLAREWLLRALPHAAPDAALFPTFDDELRASMEAETTDLLTTFLLEDRSFLDVLDAPFTSLDGRLAEHYGIPGIVGPRRMRIPLWAATHRGGLLTHASVLTMTALPERTSPAQRGAWVNAELLCAADGTQPGLHPTLPANTSADATRRAMTDAAAHPSCASCHATIDPLGFPLEHYDAVGRWREADQGVPVDATAEARGGEHLDGAATLASAIKSDPRFPACAARNLYAHATGQAPRPSDEPELAGLTATFVHGGHRMRDLVIGIVHSDGFLTRHGGT
ncbi:MAG: hypothetical protein JWP97_3212 [Labilithrix sp.]|nr:hypothetical protein [Labilithrix sp.]